jgi:hypothetical protein
MRRFTAFPLAFVFALALAGGPAAAATVCAGDLPGPKLAAPDHPPAYAPQAVPVLRTRGLRPGQPLYDASIAAERDFPYMRELALQWSVNHDKAALAKLQTYLDAWTSVYRPSFDPIDEQPLAALIDAFAVTAHVLPQETQDSTNRLLRTLAVGYLQRMAARRGQGGHWADSWQSRRIQLVAMAAWALGDDNLMARAHNAFRDQLNAAIRPDGQVVELAQTRSLAVVVDTLYPLGRASVAAQNRGHGWLDLKGRQGQSLRLALNWLGPFAQSHRWWREPGPGSAGLGPPGPLPGRPGPAQNAGLWDPTTSGELWWTAALQDNRYRPLATATSPEPPHWIWAQALCGGAS